ncbi:MAG: pyridoxamine 5'-phosphate oxidase family protein [Rubrobacteraceae bacterium]
MNDLTETAPAFVEMAHRIVWCSAATVDTRGRPRSRILHPIWQWDGDQLVGWVGTGPTPVKRAHVDATPYMSLSYWAPTHDTCVADCRVSWAFDDETRTMVWDLFAGAPEPVGYDPTIIPGWDSPVSEAFAALRLEPWRLRVFPGSLVMGQGGEILDWRERGKRER